MLPRGGRVAVALSGGPDSVALLHVLLELQRRGELTVAGAAHFHHGLRGTDADADERFCRDLADSLALPFLAGRGDVRARARDERRSIEDAARSARYEFLAQAAESLRASAVAVGHTLDDQAETFLLRLIRGAGTRGLAGIRPKAGLVIRPLLDVCRGDLHAYAAAHHLAFREDATNLDVRIPRNRIRHELIPQLQRDYSAGIVEVLGREALLAGQDEEKLEAEAIEIAASVVLTRRPRVIVDVERLRSLHPAIASRIVRHSLAQLAGNRFVGFDHIQRFLDLVTAGKPGDAVSFPGQQVRLRAPHDGETGVSGLIAELGPEPPRGADQGAATLLPFPLSIPGEVMLAGSGLAVSADWATDDPGEGRSACRIDGVRLPLAVRFRRPGDRFHPPGMAGQGRKLQDYLVDRKVARSERDRLPLVVDADDRIVWIAGHAVAEDFRVTAPSRGVIILKVRRLGGEG
jgi:tRNA(Ile)-lysidine synthase